MRHKTQPALTAAAVRGRACLSGRRACLILGAYADRFPTWAYTNDYGHRCADELRPDRLEVGPP